MVLKYCSFCEEKIIKLDSNNQKYHKECSFEVLKEYMKNYREKNKNQRKEYDKEIYERDKEKIKKRSNDYFHKNKDKDEFKIKSKIRGKRYYKKNKETRKNYFRSYRKRNKEKLSKKERELKMKNPDYRISSCLRSRLYVVLKKYTKTGKIMSSKKYGINYKKIIEHLKPFPRDISKYHIDHKRPLCSFTFVLTDGSTDLKEVKKAFAPENHQWLTAKENLRKGGN